MAWQPSDDDSGSEGATPDPYASSDDATSSAFYEDSSYGPAKTKAVPAGQKSLAFDEDKSRPLALGTIAVKCGGTALVNGINGMVMGGVVGFVMGLIEANRAEELPVSKARHVGFRTGATATSFAGFLAGYTGIKCAVAGIRNKQDLWNVGIAAGAVAAIPALANSGNPRNALSTAFASGALMMLIESFTHPSQSSSSS